MTIAEIQRTINSKIRVKKAETQERATYDYILADLIGRSISRLYSSSATYPNIGEMYPTIFDAEEIEKQKQEKQMELSVLRFKQFANSHNGKFKGVQINNE
jgi:hypothetical protein